MPELSLSPEALETVALAIDKAFVEEFGYGWNAEFIEEIAAVAAAAVAPFLAEHIAQRIEAQCGAYSHEPDEIRRCRIHNGARIAREAFLKET